MKLLPAEELFDRASAEFAAFCNEITSKGSEYVLEHAYEKVIKEDFLSLLEHTPFEPQEVEALLSHKHPLEALYQEWLGNDYSHMGLLRKTAVDCTQKDVRYQCVRQER